MTGYEETGVCGCCGDEYQFVLETDGTVSPRFDVPDAATEWHACYDPEDYDRWLVHFKNVCDKCDDRQREGEELNTLDFTGTGLAEKYSWVDEEYHLCDNCFRRAHDYLKDYF